jgi:hypothetical protein
MTITNLAQTANATWPEYTIANFQVMAEQFVNSTGAETLFLVPVIVDETREVWNKYITKPGNMDWYKEGLARNGLTEHPTDTTYVPKTLQPSLIEDEDGDTHYLPLWQTYPVPPSVDSVNHNLAEFYTIHRMLHHLLESGKPTLSRLFIPCLSEDCPPETFYGPILPSADGNADHTDQPHIMLLQPITASFDEHGHGVRKNSNDIVALVGAIFQFDAYLQNVLHEGASGVEAVVRNSCQDIATYRLNEAEGMQGKPAYSGIVVFHRFFSLSGTFLSLLVDRSGVG